MANPIEISTLDASIDHELRIEIESMIQDAKEDPLSQTCCIYKVPRSTREKNENMYTPTTISIGPFHHGNPMLKDMEKYKVIMLKRFTQRFITSLDNLIRFINDLEPKVRASYSEDTFLTDKEFQKLILLDGSFIIELFLSVYDLPNDIIEMDAILRQPKLFSDVTKDLVLLENQLPFFFLESLYQKAFPTSHAGLCPSFIELSSNFFDSFNSQLLRPNFNDIPINHFTDLLRLFHLPKPPLPQRETFKGPGNDMLLYSAKQLEEIDLKFKPVSMRNSPLGLRLLSDVLEIPRIWVDNNTAILFHNMITFEQCHYPYQHYLSDYVILLDCLINSQEDVNILIRNGIIRNSLGDSYEVVRIFDGLSNDLTLWNFNSDYSEICRALNHMGSDRRRQIWSTLKRQFLRSITGFLLNNILTLIQTVIAIRQAT